MKMFLVIILFFAILATLSPLDSGFNNFLSGFDQRLRALETARQPYQGDWIELDSTVFTSDASNNSKIHINAGSYDPSILFGIGDRIRYKLSGIPIYYYNFISHIDGQVIYLMNGLSATGSGLSFSDVAYSKIPTPNGFAVPVLADYPMVFTFPTSGITDNNSEFLYYMIGSIVVANLKFDVTLTGTPSTVEFESPIALSSIADGNNLSDGGGTRITIGTTGYTLKWNQVTDRFVITPLSGNWASGNHFSQVTFNIYIFGT